METSLFKLGFRTDGIREILENFITRQLERRRQRTCFLSVPVYILERVYTLVYVYLRRDRREYNGNVIIKSDLFFEHDGYVKGSRERLVQSVNSKASRRKLCKKCFYSV